MPGQICAIASCKSNRITFRKKGIRLMFHSFPKRTDLVSIRIRTEWIDRCNRGNKFNPCTSRVCSLHFAPSDFERDLRNELLGLPQRRVLKKTAVPSLNLSNTFERPLKQCDEDTYLAEALPTNSPELVQHVEVSSSIFTMVPSSDTKISMTFLSDYSQIFTATSLDMKIFDESSISLTPEPYEPNYKYIVGI